MCKSFWVNSPSSTIRLSDRHQNFPTNNTQRSSGGGGRPPCPPSSYATGCANTSNDELHKMVPKNATYKSKTTQNQLIDICGEMLTEKIVAEIKEAKFFSILADEATDCSNLEQMSVVIGQNFDHP